MRTDRRGRGSPEEPHESLGRATPADTNTRLAWLRTYLAVERTLMAWNRTSLSLIGFGFTIYQFLKKIGEASETIVLQSESPRNFGLAFILVGTLGTLISLLQHHRAMTYLRGRQFEGIAIEGEMPHVSLSLAITVFLAIIGIVTGISVALDA